MRARQEPGHETEHHTAAGGRAIAATSGPLAPWGDGGVVHRIVVGRAPGSGLDALNPFVGLAHDVIPPTSGFGMHPHRGIEIVTYLWQGGLRHEDSAGNSATVEPGGAERITTGRGLSHAEFPVGPQDTLGLQLWLALSEADQRLPPDFQLLTPAEVPLAEVAGAKIKVVAGEYAGCRSPLQLRTPTLYLDVTLPPGQSLTVPVPADYAGLLYVLAGRGRFGEPEQDAGVYQRLILGPGDSVQARSAPDEGEALRFILLAGRPIQN